MTMANEAFQALPKIRTSIENVDRAIQLIDEGADTGAVESKFPSWKASSVELNNIQAKMGLDVVGATTFGALSKGELDLAKAVALPTGLNAPELRDWLVRKKEAELKMRDQLEDYAIRLSNGATRAELLKEIQAERESDQMDDIDQIENESELDAEIAALRGSLNGD